jgi:hypothetical protein
MEKIQRPRVVFATDELQKQYRYTLTEPEGQSFHPDFTPDLSPQKMLEVGIFGGAYFKTMPKDLPSKWFVNAKLSLDGEKHKELNCFGVNASQPLRVWQEKGWIHRDDPHGWFQWYCRYFLGRRHIDDDRQIRRWKAMRRHIAQIKKHCLRGDLRCRKKQRQALLHWAYDSRKI